MVCRRTGSQGVCQQAVSTGVCQQRCRTPPEVAKARARWSIIESAFGQETKSTQVLSIAKA